jgi:hypothetical protein
VKILDHVDATVVQLRKEKAEAGPDVIHMMASIIEDHIYASHFFYNGSQERWIILRADANATGDAVEAGARLINIYAIDNGVFPEIFAPHREAAALGDTDFEKSDRLIPKNRKISVINRDIVMPLIDKIFFISNENF